MQISYFDPHMLTHTAITALKKAYEECTEKAAKEAIITAFKAVIQLHQDLGKQSGHIKTTESDSDYDPSEYCAAV